MKAVLALMLLNMFAVQACAAKPATLPPTRLPQPSECPEKGDIVTFRNAVEVYASMATSVTISDITKGEFETTPQFEVRKAKAIAAANFPKTMLLEGTYNADFAKYDADNQHFVIRTGAWDGMYVSWNLVFNIGNPYGIGPLFSSDQAQGIGLVKGGYRRPDYGVFDRKLPFRWSSLEARRQEWAHEITTGYNNAIVLPIPIQRAPELKDKIRVGVMARPKEPFTATNGISLNLIVADILCAVITDQDGVVLKTIATGPSRTAK